MLLRNPPILLLDEPTTGLDALSEATLVGSLRELMHGRTTVIVTHSMSLAATADRVLVVEAGRIVQDGTPAALACCGTWSSRSIATRTRSRSRAQRPARSSASTSPGACS